MINYQPVNHIYDTKVCHSISDFKILYLNSLQNKMGATTQKSLKNIIEAKYSFTHPKSQLPLQLCCWKYSEQQLQHNEICEGVGMKWPFKFYSDEGYILVLIQNICGSSQKKEKNVNLNKQGWQMLGQMKVTISLIQLLYSFSHGEIEEYYENRLSVTNQNRYVKDQLILTLYILTGQNLSSQAKLKLVSYATSLQRYILRGGMCAISKLYHEYEQVHSLGRQIRFDRQNQNQKQQQYYVEISTLIEDRVKSCEDQKLRQNVYKKQMTGLYCKFDHYKLLRKLIIQPNINNNYYDRMLCGGDKCVYPVFDAGEWKDSKNLIIRGNFISKPSQIVPYVQPSKNFHKNKEKQTNKLNDSFPFQCEITEINIRQKKKNDGMQQMNESLFIGQLTVLAQKKTDFVKIVCDYQDYIVLSDYTSIRDYNKCSQHNIRLIINCGPSLCYNYYINDLQYEWFYAAPLPTKIPADAVLYEYNIEHAIFHATQAIIKHTNNNKLGDSMNNRVLIHSAGGLYSDQNCAVVIGYLICRYLYSFDKAFQILNGSYQFYKQSKDEKLQVHKLYTDQLLTLEGRVLIASSPNYGVSLNYSFWRVYQVSNNHSNPSQSLISRYIGQINNLNQLQSLPNQSHHMFIVLSHQLITTLSTVVERWEKDSSIKTPQGLTGLKIMLGKQFQFKQDYVPIAKNFIPLLIKFEFINRNKHSNSYNNQFLWIFFKDLVESNVQIQKIQNSFRKPQPFTPLYYGFEQQNPGKPNKKQLKPCNPKQKLVFKYPYLRPVWQAIKDDQCYFIVQVSKLGASIQIVKGQGWIGLEDDKQNFFQNIVKLYLEGIEQQNIWITQEGEQSLFGDHLDA